MEVLNLWLPLTLGVNGVCPKEMVELSWLVELPVVELTSADCTYAILQKLTSDHGVVFDSPPDDHDSIM